MRIVQFFPNEVRDVEHFWIPMSDGCRLAARMWLPANADTHPVPAILEYIPYRKRDRTRERDEPMHRYFAGHGYAAVRVDLRGTGDSDGTLCDEYTVQEQADGVAVIEWLAGQPWCTGKVGMIGKSWGGFNALQIAARQPDALAAIISVCASDDRYADDAHYMGGCLLNENLIWASNLFTLGALPPDPLLVGEKWREIWLERLERTPLHVERWLRHQSRTDYWKQGSVCEDFSQIHCPVYVVGGWADGYSNAIPRLLAGLTCPAKGLIGPWAHVYPHQGVPRPAIGFLQEAVRWWDTWLKGLPTGIMDEPKYRLWMQEGVSPKSFYDVRPGRWVAEECWPSPRIAMQRLVMNWRRLDPQAGTVTGLPTRSPQTAGLAAGSWCGFGTEGEMPTDQREDDGKSLTFDSRPLTERMEILGAPRVRLSVASDNANALVAVRLNDVTPDGSSTRVTYGVLNLTHRDGHEEPAPLEPGRRYTVTVPMNHVAHAFESGHRIRVAVSTSYWPLVWPSPTPTTLTVFTGDCELELPVRPQHDVDAALPPFGEPEGARPAPATDLHPPGTRRTIRKDVTGNETVYTTQADVTDEGEPVLTRLDEIDLEIGHSVLEEFRIDDDDPLSARGMVSHVVVARRVEWAIRVETRTSMVATTDAFHVEAELSAFEAEERVFSRTWDRSIPRNLV